MNDPNTPPWGSHPYVLSEHLAALAADPSTEDLVWDGIIHIPEHASEWAMGAAWMEGETPEDRAWLLLASAGYHEAAQLIDSETDEPGQHATPAVILALIKNADRCAALGGRGDIRIFPVLGHLTKQPGHRNPDGTWKD